MRTPVPKCRDMNRNWCGTGIEGKRLTTMGKEQAAVVSALFTRQTPGVYTPAVLSSSIKNRAKTWIGVL
jgi:hypothetical protein